MKRKHVICLIQCLTLNIFMNVAVAQTNVSGFISSNTAWNLAGSPYIVVSNALLSHGYTLTINPGVIVKFNDSTALQIDGELIAIGTTEDRITFTSNQSTPAAGDWAKIHFADTSVNAIFDTLGHYISGSIMKYCDVMYGGQLGFGEIHIVNSSPYFSQCRIRNSASAGIYSWGNTFLVDSSSVKNCLNYGIYYDYGYLNSNELILQSDTIENNSTGGVFINFSANVWSNRVVKITNNYFLSNQINGAISGVVVDSLIISGNYFYNNSGVTGIISLTQQYIRYYLIECNKFISNNTNNGVLYMALTFTGTIRNNFFDYNISSSGNSVFNTLNSKYLYFNNNYLSHNSSTLGRCCKFQIDGQDTTSFARIYNNQFINNSGSSVLDIGCTQSILNSNLNILDMKFNNLSNPGAQYELYNSIQYGSPDLYIDSNYWGSTNTQHIDSVIYDYFDFANKSVVYYMPILTAPVVIDTTCPPTIITTTNKIETSSSTSTIFPNPFSQQATLKFSQELHAATFRLYNLYGQLVQEKNNINGKEIILNRENLNNGIYIYEVTDKQKRICTGKAVVY